MLTADTGLVVTPLTWLVWAGLIAFVLVNWLLTSRRAIKTPKETYPTTDVVTYVGGGRWTRMGIFGIGAAWPLLRLSAGTESLYYGPNEQWPLWRFYYIPRWHLKPQDLASVSAGISALHLKLHDGRDLVFYAPFVSSRSIVEALAARGYPTTSE